MRSSRRDSKMCRHIKIARVVKFGLEPNLQMAVLKISDATHLPPASCKRPIHIRPRQCSPPTLAGSLRTGYAWIADGGHRVCHGSGSCDVLGLATYLLDTAHHFGHVAYI